MNERSLLSLACETNFRYLALGNEAFEADGACFVRNPATPRRYDSNLAGLIRAGTLAESEDLLQRADREFAAFGHRVWSIDALTPPQFVARLLLEDGYKPHEFLVHVLEGDLNASVRAADIREVTSEEDWEAYRALDAMWWQETPASEEALGKYDSSLHAEFMLARRLKGPDARGWLACVDGEPRAFLSSWSGTNGVGMVEDLYCHPDYRHQGLATALIAHCVADARARGAGPVTITSDVVETPKHMYAAMGFRPFYVARSYTKRLKEG